MGANFIGNLRYLHESLQVSVKRAGPRFCEVGTGDCDTMRMSQRIFFLFTADWNDEAAIIWAIYDFSHIALCNPLCYMTHTGAHCPVIRAIKCKGLLLGGFQICHLYCTVYSAVYTVQLVSSTNWREAVRLQLERTQHIWIMRTARYCFVEKRWESWEKIIVNGKYQLKVTPCIPTNPLGQMLTDKSSGKGLIN